MTYQWGTPSTPVFNPGQNGVQIDASKSVTGGTLSIRADLLHVQLEGDGEATDQDIADLLGVIVDALKGDGFTTVSVGDGGTSGRQLEEVP